MDAKQFDALVNKGAITQVGIVEDTEKLDAQDFAGLHMTQHEAVAEVLAETSDDNEIEDVISEEEPVAAMNEAPAEVPTETVVPVPAVIEDAPMIDETAAEPAAEETPAPAAKKSKKVKNVAPSVDPVE